MFFIRLAILLLILLPLLIYFHFRGLIVHDEGYILNSAEKFLNGQIPYRDFHFSYTPISIFFTSFSFLVFGVSIFSSRIIMLLLSILSIILVYKITLTISKRSFYSFLASLVYVVWAPIHINFSWPVMYVLPFTFLCFYLVLKFDQKRFFFLPFLIGFVSFLIFLSKQNFGIIIVPIIVHFLIVYKKSLKSILQVFYGYVWGFVFFCTYLLITNSFDAFVADFYTFTVRKIFLNQEITTPLLYFDTPVRTFLRAGIYFSLPILSLATAGVLIYRRKYKLLFIPATTFLFTLVGLRPTSDYIHLVPLLSFLGLVGVILANKLPFASVKFPVYLFLFLVIASGLYTALFKNYYRWDTPLVHNNYYLGNKANIYTNQKVLSQNEKLVLVIDEYAPNGEYIYFDTYAPLMYFLLDRPQPTAYDFPGFLEFEKYQELTLYSLVGKEVKVVFLADEKPDTPVEKYVSENYIRKGVIGDYFLYVKP